MPHFSPCSCTSQARLAADHCRLPRTALEAAPLHAIRVLHRQPAAGQLAMDNGQRTVDSGQLDGQLVTGQRLLAAGKVKCKEQSKAKWVTQVKVNCGKLEKPRHFQGLSTFLFGCTIAGAVPVRSQIGALGPSLRFFFEGLWWQTGWPKLICIRCSVIAPSRIYIYTKYRSRVNHSLRESKRKESDRAPAPVSLVGRFAGGCVPEM